MITLNMSEDTAQALYTVMLSLSVNSEVWDRTRQLFGAMNDTGKFTAVEPSPGLDTDCNYWTEIPKYPVESSVVISEYEIY